MNFFKKIITDFLGLSRVMGITYALIWLLSIFKNIPKILSAKNLHSADLSMGSGPFKISMPKGVQFSVCGVGVVSGIREMYVRDTYLRNGALEINDGDLVLDLGANMGNFTNLALAHGKRVQVIAVEPSIVMNDIFKKSISLNHGFSERCILIRAFIGQMGQKQDEMLADIAYFGADYILEDEILKRLPSQQIDFLKCDIEGGEFELLNSASKILKITKQIAIEIHQFAGDVSKFKRMLVDQGFKIQFDQVDPDGTSTILGVRAK